MSTSGGIWRPAWVAVAAILMASCATCRVHADYAAEVLADNPIGYWQFEEVNTNPAADSSGAGRHGVYQPEVQPGVISGLFPGVPGIGGRAASFDAGAGGYVNLPGSWGGASMTEITLEAWVNPSDPITGDFQVILGGHDPNSFAHFQLHSGGNMGVYSDAGFIAAPIVPATPTDTWRHVVMTSQSGATSVYVNGAQVGASVPTVFTNVAESSNVDIGRGHVGTRWFNGLMDEMAIYDTALSPQRIAEHYVAGGGVIVPPDPPEPAALLAHWPFDADGSDTTGNNPGTLQGGATITTEAVLGGGALDLRGVNGFVDVPTEALAGEESFSVAMFVSVDSLDHACCSALLTNDSWAAGKLHVNIGTGSAVPEAAVNGNPADAWGRDLALPVDGSWVHLAFTYDGVTGIMTPYLNGVAGTPGTGGVAPAIGSGPLNIGAWDTSGTDTQDRFLNGRIDDLRLYSGVLTGSELVTLVPEPATATYIMMMMLALLGFGRRRFGISK